jgi:hypothetical protein
MKDKGKLAYGGGFGILFDSTHTSPSWALFFPDFLFLNLHFMPVPPITLPLIQNVYKHLLNRLCNSFTSSVNTGFSNLAKDI